MAHGSIPVILSDTYRPPFEELINWADVALHLPEAAVDYLPAILRRVTPERIARMQQAGLAAWEKHFKDYAHIVDSTVAVLKSRIGVDQLLE